MVPTDHKSLKFPDRTKDKNGRLARWGMALQPLDFEVQHRADIANSNADGLSREEVA